MLNKDQYNQDEYNDYYRQEAEGAEIKSSHSQDGGKSKLILLLSLIALAIAGFFGFKMLSSSSTNDTSTKEVTNVNTAESSDKKVEIPAKEIETAAAPKAQNIETQVANAVQKNMQGNGQMSAEQIAQVVAIVMSQMQQKQSTQTTPSSNASSIDIEDDTDLMSALSATNVDSVKENSETDYEAAISNPDTEIQSSAKKVDTYNKVTLEDASGEDELSKLSEQISSAMDDSSETADNAAANTYTKSIKKEVATRSNEMRIIVVKKGDTLGKIAQRAYGNVMDYKKIYKANPDILKRPDRIYIGQKLRIPK